MITSKTQNHPEMPFELPLTRFNLAPHSKNSLFVFLAAKDTTTLEKSSQTVTIAATKTKIREPKMHRVLLHNDDYTPMEFVVAILENYFDKNEPQATQIMLDVHKKGIGLCGVFTKEIAETKTLMVTEKAKMHHYPLKCTHEEQG